MESSARAALRSVKTQSLCLADMQPSSEAVCEPAWLVFARDDNGFVAMTRLRPSAPRKLTGNAGWLTQTARAPLSSAVRLHAGLARAGRGLYSARLLQDV